MLNFLKENRESIGKLIMYQFGSAVFGITLAFASSSNITVFLLSSIFSICFNLFLVYTYMWDQGAREKIRIDGNRAEYKPLKGLWISLAANVPNIIIAIIVIVFGLLGNKSLLALEWAANIASTTKVIGYFWESMYLGVMSAIAPGSNLAMILIVIPPVAMGWGAYYLGLKEIRIIKTKKRSAK